MNFSITLLLCLVNYFFNFLKYIFKLNITSYKFIIYLIIYFYKFKIINYLFMMSLIRNKKSITILLFCSLIGLVSKTIEAIIKVLIQIMFCECV